jgi:hypothetical protein
VASGALELAPWVAILVLLIVVQWSKHGWLYAASDDSYIYLGYVKRVLTEPHEFFSYNPGEHSAGTTGILYYYLLIIPCGLARLVTFFLPIEMSLLLGLYATNATLFLLVAHRYLRCWRALVPETARVTGPKLAALFLLFCAHPQFLWGVFAGMENPLAAFLALLLFDRLVRRTAFWHPALVSACLCATRPETTTVLFVIPLVAVLVEEPRKASRARLGRLVIRFVLAACVWGACLMALVLPCYLTTGRVFPSALGTQVILAPLWDLAALRDQLSEAFSHFRYWTSGWLILSYVSLVLSLVFAFARRRWSLFWLSLFIVAFFVVRALLRLYDFNVEGRYVSYLWPLYALALAVGGNGLWDAGARYTARFGRLGGAVAVATLCGITVAIPIRDFLQRFDRHVGLMNEIVVQPSRWMRANLPESARICMEPAGAIRVFTDFYLVDSVGLTTTHRRTFKGNYLDFLHDHQVDYVFDRPVPAASLVTSRVGREIKAWARGVRPWGDIRLYKVGRMPTVLITRVDSSTYVEGSHPAAAFDNSLAPWRILQEHWFAGQALPSWIEAEFERSVPVDMVVVVTQIVKPKHRATDGDQAKELRLEGKRGKDWVALKTKPAEGRTVADGRWISTLALAETLDLQGIRLVWAGPGGGMAPVVAEIMMLHKQKPYVWLWPD